MFKTRIHRGEELTTNKHEFFLDTDTYGINLHGLTRIILAAELLASFVFSASSALKVNFCRRALPSFTGGLAATASL